IIYEVGEIRVHRVYSESKDEVYKLIKYLETIAIQTGKQITLELEKTQRLSKSITLCPYGKKGRISLHYGEFYLLARSSHAYFVRNEYAVMNYIEDILSDDETVEKVGCLLSELCGINFKVTNTFNFLYSLYLDKELSASELVDYFEKMIETKQLNLKIPPKTRNDKAIIKALIEFMRQCT
ncbi:MAG: hypothetical protein ACE5KE_11130, partial [Methanosarcinales archaeon]